MKFGPTLTRTVVTDLRLGHVPALMGEPGIGKSSFMEDLAANELKTQCFTLPCNQLADKADLTGARTVPKIDPDTGQPRTDERAYHQIFVPHQVVDEAIDYALAHPDETPILFLDEINRSSSDITSAILTLITLRRLGSIDLPANLVLAVAGNDKGNVVSLDDASISRLSMYRVEPDATHFMRLHKNNLHKAIKSTLTANPHLIFCRAVGDSALVETDDDEDGQLLSTDDLDSEEILQITTPRTISKLNSLLTAIPNDELLAASQQSGSSHGGKDDNELREIIEACVGPTEFADKLIPELMVVLTDGEDEDDDVPSIQTPDLYTKMTTATDHASMVDIALGGTAEERGSVLAYAMTHPNQDHSTVLEAALVAEEISITQADLMVLLTCVTRSAPMNEKAMRRIESSDHGQLVVSINQAYGLND